MNKPRVRGPAHSENALFHFLVGAYRDQCMIICMWSRHTTQQTYFNKILTPSSSSTVAHFIHYRSPDESTRIFLSSWDISNNFPSHFDNKLQVCHILLSAWNICCSRKNSEYLKLIPVSLRQIVPKQAETSPTCVPNPYPVPSTQLIAIFHISNNLGSPWDNRLIPQPRVSSDLTGHTWAGSNPGQARNNSNIIFSSTKWEPEMISRNLELILLSLPQITD